MLDYTIIPKFYFPGWRLCAQNSASALGTLGKQRLCATSQRLCAVTPVRPRLCAPT